MRKKLCTIGIILTDISLTGLQSDIMVTNIGV